MAVLVRSRTASSRRSIETSAAWRKALGVTRLAVANAVQSVPTECLWYHADYVAPSWGRRLTRVEKIGAHIFYRVVNRLSIHRPVARLSHSGVNWVQGGFANGRLIKHHPIQG